MFYVLGYKTSVIVSKELLMYYIKVPMLTFAFLKLSNSYMYAFES